MGTVTKIDFGLEDRLLDQMAAEGSVENLIYMFQRGEESMRERLISMLQAMERVSRKNAKTVDGAARQRIHIERADAIKGAITLAKSISLTGPEVDPLGS